MVVIFRAGDRTSCEQRSQRALQALPSITRRVGHVSTSFPATACFISPNHSTVRADGFSSSDRSPNFSRNLRGLRYSMHLMPKCRRFASWEAGAQRRHRVCQLNTTALQSRSMLHIESIRQLAPSSVVCCDHARRLRLPAFSWRRDASTQPGMLGYLFPYTRCSDDRVAGQSSNFCELTAPTYVCVIR